MNEIKQLNIKSAEAYDLATEIAGITGESLTAVVTEALREKAVRARKLRDRDARIAALMDIGRRYSELPDRDLRTPDEIIGYDDNGLPT
jgi:antitoxin VapB